MTEQKSPSPITRLERAIDRQRAQRLPVIEGTEPDGWLTKLPSEAEAHD